MRFRLQLLWLATTLSYALLRIALAQRFLSQYGLNVTRFAMVELASSTLFGVASGRLIPALVAKRQLPSNGWKPTISWGMATVVGFATPDIYIFRSTHRVPIQVLAVLLSVVTLSMIVLVFELRRKLRTTQDACSPNVSHGDISLSPSNERTTA